MGLVGAREWESLHDKQALPFPHGSKQMQRKNVYIDDCLIGESATWGEVHTLMKSRGIFFINRPRGAEGPSGFYLTGTAVEHSRTAFQRPAVG